MAQIQSPETYADGQQVTAARLNNQTNGAILLPGAVTDQTALTANTVASGDTVLLHDASASALRKATAGDLLGSGLPVTTSVITGASGVDLAITPAAGQKVDVGGAFEANSLNVTGNSTIGGNETVSGNLLVTGSSTLTGNVIADNGFTSNGTANFTGQLQVNGSTAYVLYEVASLSLPAPVNIAAITNSNVATTANFGAKPSDEIWVFKCRFNYLCNGYPLKIGVRYSTETIYSGNYLAIESRQDAQGGAQYAYTHFNHEWVVNQGTALAGTTLSIDVSNAGGNGEIFSISKNADGIATATWTGGSTQPPVIFIYKYKTA